VTLDGGEDEGRQTESRRGANASGMILKHPAEALRLLAAFSLNFLIGVVERSTAPFSCLPRHARADIVAPL
jgi:hypothetical protein